ncbi:AraC family transcriptional regulator [Alteromonas aestuariivivens]|uniref:AraC family transcriptional regulator n=1 Tax=Alteromonas aestuariivivens TaxID=1938339 RepID=A0A3D8MC35_9ALTE|nr:helix-turn-helix transcriptional regulator [Alteromonas aestuariivivens]RDV27951.1 AraC family transcriptional regulator [Alteromonas aestuariivivens]
MSQVGGEFYLVITCVVIYILVLMVYWARYDRLVASRWVLAGLLAWPLLLVDEWVKTFGGASEYILLTSLFDFVPVMMMTFVYKAIKPLLLARPQRRRPLIWAPLLFCALAQLPVLFMDASVKAELILSSPIGQPLAHWPVYTVYMLTGFGVLLLGILTAEMVQNYHGHLAEQVVDPQQYRARGLSGVLGTLVAVAFASILVVTAATFGFLNIPFWQSLFHLLFAMAFLIALVALVQIRNTSPSPLDYLRLHDLQADQNAMQRALSLADKAVIELKLYKKVGLTIREFCRSSDIDPTTLAIALRVLKKQTFRQFVIHYRLDYAKQLLLRSDANVASVAKRLGLNSDKFLSEVLVNHLRKTS